MDEKIESLRQYYDIEEQASEYHLYCKICDRGWALSKGCQAIGVLLRLLDHARSHQIKPAAPRERKRR